MYRLLDLLYSLIVWVADKGEQTGADSGWNWGAHLGHDSYLSFSHATDLSNNYSAAHLCTALVDIGLSDEVGGLLLIIQINNPMCDLYMRAWEMKAIQQGR